MKAEKYTVIIQDLFGQWFPAGTAITDWETATKSARSILLHGFSNAQRCVVKSVKVVPA